MHGATAVVLAHRNQERNGDQATAHAGERQNDGGLAADLLDDRASGEAHDGGEDDRPHQQVGDLGGVDADTFRPMALQPAFRV